MKNEQNFLSALRSCPDPGIRCRLDFIREYGLTGIKGSVRGFHSEPPQKDPAPSFTTIERAMKIVQKIMGHFLGQPFKMANQGVNLAYKAHFKVLKEFDKTMDRYWSSIEFARWVGQTLVELPKPINAYLHETGMFDFRKFATYFMALPESNFQARLSELRSAGQILSDFDRALLEDLEELFIAMDLGLDQVMNAKAAQTTVDQVALGSLISEIQLAYLNVDAELSKTIGRLKQHYGSWNSIETPQNAIRVNPEKRLGPIRRKIPLVVDRLTKQMRGGN